MNNLLVAIRTICVFLPYLVFCLQSENLNSAQYEIMSVLEGRRITDDFEVYQNLLTYVSMSINMYTAETPSRLFYSLTAGLLLTQCMYGRL